MICAPDAVSASQRIARMFCLVRVGGASVRSCAWCCQPDSGASAAHVPDGNRMSWIMDGGSLTSASTAICKWLWKWEAWDKIQRFFYFCIYRKTRELGFPEDRPWIVFTCHFCSCGWILNASAFDSTGRPLRLLLNPQAIKEAVHCCSCSIVIRRPYGFSA